MGTPLAAQTLMQSLNTTFSGSLVTDHCHTFTSQRFYYRASYCCEGRRILWQAAVRLGRNAVEELRGVTTLGAHSAVIPAVKDAVEAAIDRHAFFESDWDGLSGLSKLPRSGVSRDSAEAAHG
jgi:hypothetical protein